MRNKFGVHMEQTRRTYAPGYERFVRRSIHPTAGSQYTYVLGPPIEPPIWVKKRKHFDRPLKRRPGGCATRDTA